jgi:hypothetical protein
MTRYGSKVATFPDYVASFTAEQDLLADATESMLILPCTNYCNKGTLTYLLQAMAVKG